MDDMNTTDDISIGDLIREIGGLVSLPDMYLRINQLVDDPDSSSEDIAKVVSQDPSFTVRLLRVANSSLYGFSSTVDSVPRAVSIIGTNQIRNLALSMSVARSFAGLPNELVSMDNFWYHSLLCALAARHLARAARRCDPDALFTAGLLHDIGELVIFNRLPEKAREALEIVLDSQDEIMVHEAENQVMGFSHAEVGGELARQWNLPPLLEECIAFHHDIEQASRYPRETALVHLANVAALMAEIDSIDPDDVEQINPRAWEITGLEASVLPEIVTEIRAEVGEIAKLFSEKG